MPLETQISVFVENKIGSLNEVCTALSEAHVNIRAISTVEDAEWAIVGLIVNDHEKAKQVLRNMDLRFGESTVLTVPISNKPGAIAKVTKLLSAHHISIVHTCLTAEGERSMMVLMTTNNKKANKLLSETGIE